MELNLKKICFVSIQFHPGAHRSFGSAMMADLNTKPSSFLVPKLKWPPALPLPTPLPRDSNQANEQNPSQIARPTRCA